MALPLSSNRLGNRGADILSVALSPNARFGGGGWDLIFADVSDFGVFVFNAENGRKELFLTDNNITTSDELACRVPEIAEEIRTAVTPFVDRFFPGLGLDPATFTFDVAIEDDGGNNLAFVGWTADNRIVARYDYENGSTVRVPAPGFDIAAGDWTPPRITGRIIFERQSDGSWAADACPASFPPVVTVAPVRNVSLVITNTSFPPRGDIFLDGTRLGAALGDAPLTRGRTTHLSGAW